MSTYKVTIKSWIIRLGLMVLLSAFAISSSAKTVKIAEDLKLPVHEEVTGEFHFAHGFGLIYGAMPVLEVLGGVEKMFPNAEIIWQDIFTTAQQRDAMLSGTLDFGSCTAGPFLIGWDKGVDWKVLQITGGWDAYVMVKPNGPEEIEDFIGTDMDLSPGTGTAQYFAVQEYLIQHGKNPDVLDQNWVNLPHPAALQSLVSGQLAGHFATANYALAELDKGFKKIASISDIYGGLYPVGVCTLTSTERNYPKIAAGYAEALGRVADWMKTHPAKAAKALSKSTDGDASVKQFTKWLQSPIYKSKTKNGNIQSIAESLSNLGLISKVPTTPSEIYFFPDMAGDRW